MLKLAGETDIGLEKIETISYSPQLQDSGDLEGATKSITATAKPGTADYSTSQTLAASPDARLVVNTVGLRMELDIDSFGAGTTQLNFSIEVGGVEVLTGSFGSAGAGKLTGVNLSPTQFPLGSANTIGVFLWADHADGAVISKCELWVAIGTYGTLTNPGPYTSRTGRTFYIDHKGWIQLWIPHNVGVGTGNVSSQFVNQPNIALGTGVEFSVVLSFTQLLFAGKHSFGIWSSVATDLSYYRRMLLILRSEQ